MKKNKREKPLALLESYVVIFDLIPETDPDDDILDQDKVSDPSLGVQFTCKYRNYSSIHLPGLA